MLYSLFIQLSYLVAWSIVLAGAVVLLRRGRTIGTVPILFGAAISILMECFWVLVVSGAIRMNDSVGMHRVTWIPQLLGMFFFAVGFLQLARATRKEE
jgi:hypothetical protein